MDDKSISPEERARFRVLRALEHNPEYSQRELAKAIGLCLGRTNYLVQGLIGKGLLKAAKLRRSDRKLTKIVYVLTHAGLRHRLILTKNYIAFRKAEYQVLKAELESLEREVIMPAKTSKKFN